MPRRSTVARGLASRQRLKHDTTRTPQYYLRSRQRIGFSSEIETRRCPLLVSPVYRRQRIGFSSEIETISWMVQGIIRRCRQRIGFSSEIETSTPSSSSHPGRRRQRIGFSSEIETDSSAPAALKPARSPEDWLLVRD